MLHIIAQMAGVGMFEEDWAVPVNCPAPPQGGGKPQKRERKRASRASAPHYHRAGASPRSANVRGSGAVPPALPQGGGKPHRRELKRFNERLPHTTTGWRQ